MFTYLEVWTDVQCAGGTRLATIDRSDLAQCGNREALAADEWLRFVMASNHDAVQYIKRGRVIRECTESATVFNEWRIADIEDGSGSGPECVVSCNSILADLGYSVYTQVDGEGNPYHSLIVGPVSPEVILDSEVTDANTLFGRTWIETGTVDDQTPVMIDGSYLSARMIIDLIRGHVASELRLVRDGITRYLINLLDEVGSTAPVVYVQTGRNLGPLERERRGNEMITIAGAIAKDDSTNQGVSFARWIITAVDTGTDKIRVQDERGSAYPGPIRFTGQLSTGTTVYVAQESVAFAAHQILSSVIIDANTSEIEVADASTFTVGKRLGFYTTNSAPGARLAMLRNPTAIADHGLFPKMIEADNCSGAINWAENPLFATWTTPANPPDGSTKFVTSGTVTGAQDATNTNDFGGTGYRLTFLTAGANAGGWRGPEVTIFDDSPYLYRAWMWIYITTTVTDPLNGSITLQPRFKVDNSSAGTPILLDDTSLGLYVLCEWELSTVSKTSQGFYIEARGATIGAGVGPDIDFTIVAWGVQPLAWQRSDTYEPMANDCWHTVNDALENFQNPTSYRVAVADLNRLDGTRFSDEALVLGGTISIKDTELGITVSQRVLSIERDLLEPLNTRIETGRPPRTAAGVVRKRALRDDQIIAKAGMAVGAALYLAGASRSGSTAVDDDATDSDGLKKLFGREVQQAFAPKLGGQFTGITSM